MKRLSRNPSARIHPYGRLVLDTVILTEQAVDVGQKASGREEWTSLSTIEREQAQAQGMLGQLIDWCPTAPKDWTKVYEGPLPWDRHGTPKRREGD